MKKMQSLFASQKETFGDSNPDTGEGGLGQWPPAGVSENLLVGIEVNDEEKFFWNQNGKSNETDAMLIRFKFQTAEPLEGEEEALSWGGAPFRFPYDMTSLPDNNKKQVEISRNRLCGHLSTILGVKVGTDDGVDIDDAMPKAIALSEGETQVVLEVECRYDERGSGDKKKTYRNEFIKSNLTA